MIRNRIVIATALLTCLQVPAWAQGCKDFKWDVSREQALFAGKALEIKAGSEVAKAPQLQVEQLYDVGLVAQEQVKFAAVPGKKMISDGASAGLMRVQVAKAGTYRVSVSHAFWIDVVDGGKVLGSLDFSGSHDCDQLRKVVAYDLPEGVELIIQLSGNVESQVLLSVTAVNDKT